MEKQKTRAENMTSLPGLFLICLIVFVIAPIAMIIKTDSRESGVQRLAASEVAERERAFAARAQVIDPKDAFLEFFATDALMFNPMPVSAAEILSQSPSWGISLYWWPTEIAVSADGRLAYSTGPVESRRSATEPVRCGTYFSIWRRNEKGIWEVIADLGTDTPELFAGRQDETTFLYPFSEEHFRPSALQDTESAYLEEAGRDPGRALENWADSGYRLHLPGKMPQKGIREALLLLAGKKVSWECSGEISAESGDFGVVYGSGQGGFVSGSFGFLRVWRRNIHKEWRLLAEVINVTRS